MSKSMLVIDTPKCCNDCILLMQDMDTGIFWCKDGFPVRQLNEKSDMCPLIDLTSIKRYDLNDDHWACYQKGSASMDEYEEGDWIKYTDIVGE